MTVDNLLLELRNAAKTCSNVDYRDKLKRTADDLDQAITYFYGSPTAHYLTMVNGFWALGVRVLENVPPEGKPAPLAPPMEQMRMAA